MERGAREPQLSAEASRQPRMRFSSGSRSLGGAGGSAAVRVWRCGLTDKQARVERLTNLERARESARADQLPQCGAGGKRNAGVPAQALLRGEEDANRGELEALDCAQVEHKERLAGEMLMLDSPADRVDVEKIYLPTQNDACPLDPVEDRCNRIAP